MPHILKFLNKVLPPLRLAHNHVLTDAKITKKIKFRCSLNKLPLLPPYPQHKTNKKLFNFAFAQTNFHKNRETRKYFFISGWKSEQITSANYWVGLIDFGGASEFSSTRITLYQVLYWKKLIASLLICTSKVNNRILSSRVHKKECIYWF